MPPCSMEWTPLIGGKSPIGIQLVQRLVTFQCRPNVAHSIKICRTVAPAPVAFHEIDKDKLHNPVTSVMLVHRNADIV